VLPDGSPLLVCGGRVQRRHQLVNCGSHDGDDVGALWVGGGKRVNRAGRDCYVFARLKDRSLVTDEDLQATSKDNEPLVGLVVSMTWAWSPE
jgi:hypothetical protein